MSTSTMRRPQNDKLPRQQGATGGRSVLAGVAAAIGAVLLLVGVPLLLVLLVGNPLPTSAPSTDWLTADVNATLIINVLACLVWAVWAHFVVCFLAEFQALRKGRVSSDVLLGGGSQVLARKLVAGILLLTGGAMTAHGVATAAAAPAAPTTGTSISATAEAGSVQATSLQEVKGETAAPTAKKFYEVKPPTGRHHDTLWDISERLLGDPLRYKEIYQLNKDRLQPDGARLTDADLIRPGWQLLLPGDAAGPGVQNLDGPAAPTPGANGADGAAMSDGASGASMLAPDQNLGPVARSISTAISKVNPESIAAEASPASFVGSEPLPDTVLAQSPTSQDSRGMESILMGGGLIVAGLVRALTARGGPTAKADPAALRLAAAANLRRARFLDQALRSLALMRRQQGEPMPEVRFVYVNDAQIVLHLLDSPTAPERPWTVSEDNRAWTLHADDLAPVEVRGPAPYPALVTVAEVHGFDLLVDLELASGPISVAGHDSTARDLVTAMALDLTSHGWADRVEVVMVGFGRSDVDLDLGNVRTAPALDDVLADLEHQQHGRSQAVGSLGIEGVLQGRQRGRVDDCAPVVLFLSAPPSATEAARLNALTPGRTPFAVVCVGDAAEARWRFVVDENGAFQATALGLSGSARRVPPEAHRSLRAMVDFANEQREGSGAALESLSPAASVEASALSGHTGDHTPQSLSASPIAVRVLGPVSVDAPNHIDAARRGLVTELVVLAALHPDGLHDAMLRSSLWPRGVEEDVVAARLNDAQAWLGTDAQGHPYLSYTAEGLIRLSPAVPVDYTVLATAATSAQDAGELERLEAALAAGTGEVFSGDGRGYGWLAFARAGRECRELVITTARRAADLALASGDRTRAVAVLRQGLRLVPVSEELWRQLLRLLSDGTPTALGGAADEMYSTLRSRSISPEPETESLVTELLPDHAMSS